MANPQNNSDAYDSPWKEVLEHAFPEFMAFYFPAARAQIDWAQGHEFKSTELRQVVIGPSSISCVRSTGEVGTGNVSWIYLPSSIG